IAVLYPRHLSRILDDARHPGADALADAAPGGEHAPFTLERVALDGAAGAALHRLRPCLQDVDRTALAVARPLDVHRPAIVLLDEERLPRELHQIVIVQTEALLVGGWHVHRLHTLGGALRRVHHLYGLAAQIAPYHRVLPGAQRRLVDVELVGV